MDVVRWVFLCVLYRLEQTVLVKTGMHRKYLLSEGEESEKWLMWPLRVLNSPRDFLRIPDSKAGSVAYNRTHRQFCKTYNRAGADTRYATSRPTDSMHELYSTDWPYKIASMENRWRYRSQEKMREVGLSSSQSEPITTDGTRNSTYAA